MCHVLVTRKWTWEDLFFELLLLSILPEEDLFLLQLKEYHFNKKPVQKLHIVFRNKHKKHSVDVIKTKYSEWSFPWQILLRWMVWQAFKYTFKVGFNFFWHKPGFWGFSKNSHCLFSGWIKGYENTDSVDGTAVQVWKKINSRSTC